MAKKLNDFLKYKDMARWYFDGLVVINALPKNAIVRELNKNKVRVIYERRRRKG